MPGKPTHQAVTEPLLIPAIGYAAQHSMVSAAKAQGGGKRFGRDNPFGGYSDVLIVKEDFALEIPPALKPEVAAPILCAGVTTFSPMKHWGVKAGDKVGIIGIGGLGNMAAKLAKANFCAEHGFGPDIEVIAIQDVCEAYRKVEHGEVRLRNVIDMATLKANANA